MLSRWTPSVVVAKSVADLTPKDAALDAHLEWSWDLWRVIALAQIDHPNEISGYAACDAERRVVWVKVTGRGGMTSVVTTEVAQAEALLEAAERGLIVNVQWHTHYGFEPCFSPTDDAAQETYLEDLPAGDMTFVCFSEFSAVTRRWVWDKQGKRHNDGRATLDGHLLPEGSFYSRWATKGANESLELDAAGGAVPAPEKRLDIDGWGWVVDERGVWSVARDPTPDWDGAIYRDPEWWRPDLPPG